MLAVTRTAALSGIEGISVKVEVDSGPGLPSFNVIGLGDTAVKEAADRVRSAIVNSGFEYPGADRNKRYGGKSLCGRAGPWRAGQGS